LGESFALCIVHLRDCKLLCLALLALLLALFFVGSDVFGRDRLEDLLELGLRELVKEGEELVGLDLDLLGGSDEATAGIVRLGEPIPAEDHLARDDAKGDVTLFFLRQFR